MVIFADGGDRAAALVLLAQVAQVSATHHERARRYGGRVTHPAWTDDEIVAGVREFAEANCLPDPAPAETADEFDALTGLAMPPLLRRIYTEAANGGFGPCGGSDPTQAWAL